jgi:two-component system cell cycle sensor histidine kinase/response regulator CckA
MDKSLRVLIVEDSDSDAALDVRMLEKAGYKVSYEIVATAAEMKAALHKQAFDLILADHNLPQFDSLKALALLQETGLNIPFIVVSGSIGEEIAVEVMKAGANDYVMKDHLSRLGTAVDRELREAEARRENKRIEEALWDSERNYRDLVERANDGICVVQDGLVKFTNSQLARIWGGDVQETIGMSFANYIFPDELHKVVDRYKRRMAGEQLPSVYQTALVRKDGSRVEVELNVGVIVYKEKPAELIFIRDISDRKKMEEEQQRLARLESIGTLAGGIAHDFNNILTAMLGNISLAKMEAHPGSELYSRLEDAEKASIRARDLTKQLLTFSKGGAPVRKMASLKELVQDTASFALRGSNVKCQFSIPDDLWQAEIDEGQISQVINNLVVNGQQAMPAGGTIELRAENITINRQQSLGRILPLGQGDYVRITVADQGTGISQEHLARIFDPFFTTKQKGSGLGLATSFSIVRNHGGHLGVESKLGYGSTFYVYLPASTKTATAVKKEKEKTTLPAKARILVMDDEETVREVAGRMLKHIGYEDTEFAADGTEAIKFYKEAMKSGKPFDAVILDLTIPGGMGGKQTIQKLREIDPEVKSIVSSGYSGESAIAEYKEYGFKGMVAKPYTIDQLRQALHDLIG